VGVAHVAGLRCVVALLDASWTIPWTTLGTVIVFWQPFTRNFAHWQQSTTGLTHWWFAHQEAVGAIHLAWAVVVIILVFAVPSPRARGGHGVVTGERRRWWQRLQDRVLDIM
jgi:hypothetical protein